MSSLIDSILGENAQTDQLSQELLLFVKFLKTESAEHMKRVIKILPEFDLHDQSHSEKVEENMSLLIGESLLRKLSSVDLFLLSASAHLHDCGMAPADWELKALDVVAKATDRRFDVLKDNINYIKDNKAQIFEGQESEASNWLFSPSNEKELFKQLANEMKACQEYLDGYSISETNDKDDKDAGQILKDRRVDYIRRTHHERSERYIKNMEKKFCGKLESAPGKQLADILAGICRAHGEDLSYTSSELKSSITISAKYKVNPQFVAMMLRLGDIIHFSKDRAPFVLRNATQFKSDYSHYQWELKEGGVNYQIVDGKVIYTAYCEEPKLYYGLLEYTDWIKREIANFNELKRNWSKEYKDVCVDEVNTSDITYDSNKFIPAPGKKFTLSQNKIIELLMGVQLYKDPYACIRELYQNALDAVRCNIDKNKSLSKDIKGLIEFGLETDERGKYLYCLDNGVGMSQLVIENYLLNIGNSYYKSQDFFRLQHKWNSSFTPTSQFGIGILSCFMIGDAMEIITKTDNDKEPRIICIDGPLELVYYKPASSEDAELIHSSGTMVKIYLKGEYKRHLVNSYSTSVEAHHIFSRYYSSRHIAYFETQELYHVIDKYVVITSEGIEVKINYTKGDSIPIRNKPYLIESLPTVTREIYNLISENRLEIREWLKTQLTAANSIFKYLNWEYIRIKDEGIEFVRLVFLPKIDISETVLNEIINHASMLIICKLYGYNKTYCVDGISLSVNNEIQGCLCIENLASVGVVNFIGKERPQLSIDRSQIVRIPKVLEANAKKIATQYFEKIVKIAITWFTNTSEKYNPVIIKSIFRNIFPFSDYNFYNLFVDWILSEDMLNFNWPLLSKAIGEDLPITEFLNKENICICNYDYFTMDPLTASLITIKLLSATEVYIEDNNLILSGRQMPLMKEDIFKVLCLVDDGREMYDPLKRANLYIKMKSSDKGLAEFDIIPKFLPIVSSGFFSFISEQAELSDLDIETVSDDVILTCLTLDLRSLVMQDPWKIHPRFGLCEGAWGEPNIYEFGRKIQDITLPTRDENLKSVLFVYIPPRKLSDQERQTLEMVKDRDQDYYKGVMEGWSILVTGMNVENIKILPGKKTRKEAVKTISSDFWEIYSGYIFQFMDGKNLKDYKI